MIDWDEIGAAGLRLTRITETLMRNTTDLEPSKNMELCVAVLRVAEASILLAAALEKHEESCAQCRVPARAESEPGPLSDNDSPPV